MLAKELKQQANKVEDDSIQLEAPLIDGIYKDIITACKQRAAAGGFQLTLGGTENNPLVHLNHRESMRVIKARLEKEGFRVDIRFAEGMTRLVLQHGMTIRWNQ